MAESANDHTNNDQRRRALLVASVLFLVAAAILIWMVVSGKPDSRTVTTRKAVLEVPGEAYLDGRILDAIQPLTYMVITVWDQGLEESVCELAHGNRVDLLDARRSPDEESYYFKIRSMTCEGWVSDRFLDRQRHNTLGDVLP